MVSVRIAAVLGLLVIFSACGLKGPLYEPAERQGQQAAPDMQSAKKSATRRPAPQLQKEDRDRADAGSEENRPSE